MMYDLSLNQVVMTVLTAIITWALARLSIYLDSKAQEIKQNTDESKLNTYIELAIQTALDTVRALNQTVVEDFKAKASDGKLTEEEKQLVLDQAVETVMLTLSDPLKELLGKVFTDLPGWIELQIENAVGLVKLQKTDTITFSDDNIE